MSIPNTRYSVVKNERYPILDGDFVSKKSQALITTLNFSPLNGAMALLVGVESVVIDSPSIDKSKLIPIIRELKTKIEKAQESFDIAETLSEKLAAAEQCNDLLTDLAATAGEVRNQVKHFPDDRLRGVLKIIAAIVAIAAVAIIALLAVPALPGLAIGAFVAAGTVGGSAALIGGAVGCVAAGVAAYRLGVSADFDRMHTRMLKTAENEGEDIVRIQNNTINHILNLNVADIKTVLDKLVVNKNDPGVAKFLRACEKRMDKKIFNDICPDSDKTAKDGTEVTTDSNHPTNSGTKAANTRYRSPSEHKGKERAENSENAPHDPACATETIS
jgi:gas vesicle protein